MPYVIENYVTPEWHEENGVQTSYADDIPMFLAVVESANRHFNNLFQEEVHLAKKKDDSFPVSGSVAFHRESIWFRGHNSVAYKLIPSAKRNLGQEGLMGVLHLNEAAILRDFKDNAIHLSDNRMPYDADDIDWLALGQHYGLKTRLLDFSTNPLVALSFACDGVKSNEDDIAVYMFDAASYMIHFYPQYCSTAKAKNSEDCIPSTFPAAKRKLLDECGFSFDDTIHNYLYPVPVYTLPLNKRLVAQSGTFLMWKGNDSDLLSMKEADRFVKCIRIKNGSSLNNRIVKHLIKFGFSQSALYADLSQAAHGLNNRYALNIASAFGYLTNSNCEK